MGSGTALLNDMTLRQTCVFDGSNQSSLRSEKLELAGRIEWGETSDRRRATPSMNEGAEGLGGARALRRRGQRRALQPKKENIFSTEWYSKQ